MTPAILERDVKGVCEVAHGSPQAARAAHVPTVDRDTIGGAAGWGRSGTPGPLGSIPELLDA
eukprot:9986267-Alexandrium_andersonii.AAC.1